MLEKLLLIWLLPLAAFLIQVFLGKRLYRRGDWVSCGAVFTSFIFSCVLFFNMLGEHNPHFKWTTSWDWIFLPDFQLKFGLLVDTVTLSMLVVITLVSLLVHVYSIGYMAGDKLYSRYFAYLSFFTFSMVGLVLVDNLFSIYIFWELVGLASYLLIGFWFEKPSASNAAKKAFLTTRIGDIGMFLGILIIFFNTNGILEYEKLFQYVADGKFTGEFLGMSLLTVAGILLFFGAIGKSAQFPLHIWLPDAMEGPTPVSALIHAATMVAAGVYLVTRMFVFFTPDALLFIAYIGSFTALFAATMALTHNDIKKVLAYSTISQLGYMMMGLGVGAYVAGFLHLVTHAAFKASLFLCSGSVIHAAHTQDMRQMGGLKQKMPITFWATLIATLSISGVPFFSGFVSKDMLLAGALSFATENPQHALIAIFAFITAGLTAFYMFRLVFMTFFGAPKDPKVFSHAHESPLTMTLPLMILSVLSFGFIFTYNHWFEAIIQKPALLNYQSGLSVGSLKALGHAPHDASHLITVILSIALAGTGIFLSYLFYFKGVLSAKNWAHRFQSMYQTLVHLYWVDELYEWTVVRPLIRLNNFMAHFDNRVIDDRLVDGWVPLTSNTAFYSGDFDNVAIDQTLVDGTGLSIAKGGMEVRKIQTGRIQQYLILALAALCIILLILML
ncbi:MAG: hypothetical protein A3B70_08575 [Deltaproteobacteria bacterium RIFCSPHIGHO2_02_FULL_40_11]|nr:MAG: hypothetical protein A3B70_08575 [Deltaproteobacteria bacterium RIFCSPHIGHO2_02_FULL_40_11]